MKHGYLGVAQMRFAEILWREAPLGSGELVKICEKELNWKKSTTYTVLRKLCEQGIFQNKDGVITVLITKENFIANRTENFIEETLDGSLPAFLAAFTQRKQLSPEDIAKLQEMIDHYGEANS